jgi:vacuolar protein sorting-associated protein VTA1
MAAIPGSLKSFQAFFRRAEELEKNVNNRENLIVAYYCRFHAVSKISKAPEWSQPDVQSFVFSQMDIMEKVKPVLAIRSDEKPYEICRHYAETVFGKADSEDSSGFADKGTAKIFYAAGTFLDILEQFPEADLKVYRMLLISSFHRNSWS